MNSEGLSQTVRDLPQAWQGLGRNRQLAIAGAAAAVVVAIIAAVLYMQRPQHVALYTNLNDQDAAAIAAKLRDLKVPYTVGNGGSTITVPQEQAGDLRLQLAGAGLPSGTGVGMIGMEVFDKTNLGITDFAQRLNFQRGLEGELTRTIARLAPVETARVHLVLPQERLFSAQQRDTTASVVIKLRPGARLSDEQVSNVRFLVSKSVEGLKPENVAVVDVNGNALGKLDTGQTASSEVAANRLSIQRQRETELEQKIQGMLTQSLGANKAVVRANISLDWSEVKQNIESYTPGQPVSEKDAREQFTGRGAEVVAPGGVPGTQSNIPSFQTVAGAGTGDSSYNRSDVTRNFQPGKDVQSIVRAPGDVKTIGIAVMVDQSVQGAQVDQITQLVTAAAGIQPQRGDQVSVVTVPFDNSLSQQLRQQQEEQQRMDWFSIVMRVSGVLVGLIGLFVLYRMMANAVRPRPQQVVVAESAALPGGTAGLLPPARVQQELVDALQAAHPLPSPAEIRAELEPQIREQVQAELDTKLREQYQAEFTAKLAEIQRAEEERKEQERLALEAQRREEEIIRAAEEATAVAKQREQMREQVVQLAATKPEALAEILNQWLEQGRTTATPARRATSTLN